MNREQWKAVRYTPPGFKHGRYTRVLFSGGTARRKVGPDGRVRYVADQRIAEALERKR